MASLNQVSIIGFVGDAPRVNQTQTGRKVASLSIATTEKGFTTRDGKTIPDRTEWHRVVLWGNLAEIAEKYIRKGSSIFVQGKLRNREYEQDGAKKFITEIEADTLQLLDRKTENGGSPASYPPPTNDEPPF